MGKWLARLEALDDEKIAGTPSASHCQNCQNPVLSVLSVSRERGAPEISTRPLALERPYRLTPADADAAHAEPWDEPAIGRFVARVSLFLRRGINATDADDLAERLHLRDLQGDDRALCMECKHLAGRTPRWRCLNARAAGVGADLPSELATLLQHCDAFGATW